MNTVALYSRFEASFESALVYENPVQGVAVEVEFECAGTRVSTAAFWDGERTWRVRFSPEIAGLWTWRVRCPSTGDSGFHDQAGSFECVPAAATNVLHVCGPIRVSGDKRHFVHAGGTPFF